MIIGGRAVVVITDAALGHEANLRQHLRHPLVGPADLVLGKQQEYLESELLFMSKYVGNCIVLIYFPKVCQ